jgi:signal transduction histidine kinase
MAALGTLSAGLAHELNNPAAAARRSADQLRASLEEWQKVTAEVNRLGLDGRRAEILDGLRRELAEGRPQGGQLSLLEQSEAESELQTWLEAHSIPDAWELAPTLVAAGWNAQRLTDLSRSFSEAEMGTTVRWLATVSGAYALLGEVSTATERISEIVRSVKEYAYLDQAPVQQVDVKRGLENTLVILRHKMKEGGAVEREYAPNLPLIEAYGSELNQVWTNLLDNAIDATEGKGHLVVRTRSEPNQIVVEIQDDGPGIAPAVQKRIFEPFFTTKPPGVGTGLGLHIAYTIVHKHYGRINVTSQPGKTCFAVQLPVCLPRAKG